MFHYLLAFNYLYVSPVLVSTIISFEGVSSSPAVDVLSCSFCGKFVRKIFFFYFSRESD